MTDEPNSNAEVRPAEPADAKAAARRQALTRMGLFAAFTAPLLLGVLKAEKASAVSP